MAGAEVKVLHRRTLRYETQVVSVFTLICIFNQPSFLVIYVNKKQFHYNIILSLLLHISIYNNAPITSVEMRVAVCVYVSFCVLCVNVY